MTIPAPTSIKTTDFVSIRKSLHELNANLVKIVLWATEFIKTKKSFLQANAISESYSIYFKSILESNTCISDV